MILGIDNVGVAVRDLGASLEFYRALGFEVVSRSETDATVQAGSARLYLFRTENVQPVARSFDLSGNPVGIDHLSLQVANVDGLCDRLRARGIEIARPPQDYEWGARAACIYDPDGNNIWLLQR